MSKAKFPSKNLEFLGLNQHLHGYQIWQEIIHFLSHTLLDLKGGPKPYRLGKTWSLLVFTSKYHSGLPSTLKILDNRKSSSDFICHFCMYAQWILCDDVIIYENWTMTKQPRTIVRTTPKTAGAPWSPWLHRWWELVEWPNLRLHKVWRLLHTPILGLVLG
jgi:hypothetical protein